MMTTRTQGPQDNKKSSHTSNDLENVHGVQPSTCQPETMPQRLFLYGTLMASPLLAWLTTGTSSNWKLVEERRLRGVLHGYSRRAVLNAYYRAIIKGDENDKVEGFIFYPRNDDDCRHMDDFEGDLYRKEKVTVVTTNGVEVEAYVYVWNKGLEDLAETDWSYEEFESTRLQDCLDLYDGMEFI